MSTLANLRKTASKTVTFTDSTTPAEFFGATVRDDLIGVVTYLLRGKKDDDEALIVGRIQDGIAYAGDRMLGGHCLGRHEYSQDAFIAIINHTKWNEV